MRIALVDDDADFRAQTARMLLLLLDERRTQAQISSFDSAEGILADGTEFDIYLLDVMMPGMNGIELARHIRRKQPEAPIVFFTTSTDFALESYSVDAADYVVKPFTCDVFARALARAFRRRTTVRPAGLLLKDSGELVRLPFADIVFAKADGHYQVVQLADGRSRIVSQSLQELWEKLAGDVRFVRIGRTLIVNLAHVTSVSGGTLLMADGRSFPVPRRVFAEVKDALLRFYCA